MGPQNTIQEVISMLLSYDHKSSCNNTKYRVVAKISSCWVNTTSRPGIKHRGVSFGSNFLPFSNKSSQGPHS